MPCRLCQKARETRLSQSSGRKAYVPVYQINRERMADDDPTYEREKRPKSGSDDRLKLCSNCHVAFTAQSSSGDTEKFAKEISAFHQMEYQCR